LLVAGRGVGLCPMRSEMNALRAFFMCLPAIGGEPARSDRAGTGQAGPW
jgi:hypothetical protein